MRTFVYASFDGLYPPISPGSGPWRGAAGPGADAQSFKEMNEVSLPPPREEDGRDANLQAGKDAFIPLQALGALPSHPSPRVSPCPRCYGNV